MCSAIFGSVIDLETADAGDSDDDDNAELFGWLPNLRVCKLEGLCSDIFRHLRIHPAKSEPIIPAVNTGLAGIALSSFISFY